MDCTRKNEKLNMYNYNIFFNKLFIISDWKKLHVISSLGVITRSRN